MTTKRILILLLAVLIVSLAPGGFLLACEEEATNVWGSGKALHSDARVAGNAVRLTYPAPQ